MDKIINKINLGYAAAVTVLSSLFGVYWYMFAAFLIFNIVDYATGMYKARITKKESSYKGLQGIIKKVGYWVIIGIAFFIAYFFTDFGNIIGVNLDMSVLIGWFTLGMFIINEIRSILENLVEIGVDVPIWLIKGLEVADKKINKAVGSDKYDDTKESDNN